MLSGGLDSTALAYKFWREQHEVHAITFDYGQKHRIREGNAAWHVATHLELPYFKVVNLRGFSYLFKGQSALMNAEVDVPDGHYTDESMKATVVPNRNMVMLSIATSIAIAHGIDTVAYAAHAGDHAIYPDCRPEFFRRLGGAMELCDWSPVKLQAPFMGMTKGQVVAANLGAPFALTWSCYKGGDLHCGTCGTCVERKEAFVQAGVFDPTKYAS